MKDRVKTIQVKSTYGNKAFVDCLINVIKAKGEKAAG